MHLSRERASWLIGFRRRLKSAGRRGITLLITALLSPHLVTGQTVSSTEQHLVLRGRVEEILNDSQPQRRFVFRTKEGHVFRFRPGDRAADIFHDERVRQQELQILAAQRPSGELELIRVYSVRQGRMFLLSYGCETCSITEPVPGRCPCCGAPLELREVAVPDR